MFNKILLPVDGSSHSLNAVDAALSICTGREDKTQIVVVHVCGYSPNSIGVDLTDSWDEEWLKHGKELVETVGEKIAGMGVRHESKVLRGNPAAVIASLAKSDNIDLIVMGSRGLGAFGEFILGSVSHSVLHNAPCPILIFK